MLVQSQPLSEKALKKLGIEDKPYKEGAVKSQHIGKMFDDLLDRK